MHTGTRWDAKPNENIFFSYLIDMQAALHPALSDGRLLQKVIFSFDDVEIMEKQKHYNRLIDYIWQTIANLAERVACQRDEEAPIAGEEIMNSPDPHVPTAKRHDIQMTQPSIYLTL
jgi:hypothetical protein